MEVATGEPVDDRVDEYIGLLFVHGVGEQERWEHLRESVIELAELIRRTDGAPSVTVIDRTGDWKLLPGVVHPDRKAPLSLDVRLSNRRIRYECHEVWWADLGSPSGVLDSVRFWLWGLGQWCAPIYRDMDASRLATGGSPARLTGLPRSVVGTRREVGVRLQLFLAALAAAFVACTWELAKRLLALLLRNAPSSSLIVQYVGDVRTFTARAAPGESGLTDPGYPRRVGIRRRMMGEMITLATRAELKQWYVLAHSLGTVVAYNALTEIGHTLPNYLTQEQWALVPEDWRTDPATRLRSGEIARMMPARPHWVEDHELIDRKKLFGKLGGFLTYGSPLDKFAGLWPRIVATATDRGDGSPFPDGCDWVNLHAPTDPVAGRIDCYQEPLGAVLPPVRNCRTRWSPWAGLEHITYFRGFERHRKGQERQRVALAQWLLGGAAAKIPERKEGSGAAFFFAWFLYTLILALLWAAATAAIVLAQDAWDGSFDWGGFAHSFCALVGPVAGLFIAPILLIGVVRWARESWLNWKLSRADDLPPKVQNALFANFCAATLMAALSLPLLYLGKMLDLSASLPWLTPAWLDWLVPYAPVGWTVALLCGTGLLGAACLQTALNSRDPT
ncbi:MAG TPA: hypothetical protein VGB54_09045 [Allosphingosinicella sp.]